MRSTTGSITHAILKINGVTVKEWSETDPGDGPIVPTGLGVSFDSTHFADGAMVTVSIEAWDDQGGHGSAQDSAPVNNRGIAYGRHDFEYLKPGWAGVPSVTAAWEATNHTYTADVSSGWTSAEILGSLATATIFYVNTHGDTLDNKWWFNSDRDEANGIWENIYPRFDEPNVLEVRQTAVGTGLPPWNSGVPPISIGFTDACTTGQTNEFAAGLLWPYESQNGWTVDQAVLGWSIYSEGRATTATQTAFWNALAEGYTVNKARNRALDAYSQALNIPRVPNDTLRVWGDFATTMHGVYLGIDGDTPSTEWYR
jgi:hypothetical protein